MSNNKKKRVFLGSIATETNTFSPLLTGLRDFKDTFYAPPGHHPATPTLCSAVFPVARAHAQDYGWELIEGTAAWSEPAGLVNQETWLFLRNQLLDELRAALPVDIVLLGLHGAMVAQNCLDCEGELLAMVREMVGPDVLIGATLDPHSHLTDARVQAADLLVAFKEFPHTDFVIAAESLAKLAHRAACGDIKPVMSVYDVKMIDVLPTTREPMRSFVDKLVTLEGKNGVLSVSAIHGFMAGDVPDLGAKILVITDNRKAQGDALAAQLGQELYSFRGTTRPDFLPPDEAIEQALASHAKPVVIADVWDNPGGGTAGDNTVILQNLIARKLSDVALATIWDPIAVRICFSAGEGASIRLRIGGKVSDQSGDPIDAVVKIHKLVANATQSFGTSVVPLGDCAWVEVNGIHIILNTVRSQVYNPDIFSNLGIDPLAMRLLVVKSTNHFRDAFARISEEIIYAAVDGPYPSNPVTNPYTRLTRLIWPRHADPHGQGLEHISPKLARSPFKPGTGFGDKNMLKT